MAKVRKKYVCQNCGYESPQWLGRCPDCGSWSTFVEEVIRSQVEKKGTAPRKKVVSLKGTPIIEVPEDEHKRFSTGYYEVDRVLGGGIVPGALMLLSGDPGIGKSTLTMQIMDSVTTKGDVLYISAEESKGQIATRAKRLNVSRSGLLVVTESDIHLIEETINQMRPSFLVIDSIQTVYDPDLASATGSISQLRSVAAKAMTWSKTWGIPTLLIGHVTKDGSVAGPRVLEHMVDAVLYFEGDRHHQYRMLRALKNRFGSTNEVGLFDMQDQGLIEVSNASKAFLAERPKGASGSAVAALMEGSRPILVEIQALAAQSFLNQPRRVTSGCDYSRVMMLLAVLEKRLGIAFANKDVYVNVIGGLKVDEPASDLAISMAMASQALDMPLPEDGIFIGEVGLTGEVRLASHIDRRLKEAQNLGFTKAFLPRGYHTFQGMELVEVGHLKDIFRYLKK